MTFAVRPGTADEWSAYREIRLRMLAESPDAYASSSARESDFTEDRWREWAANPLLRLAYASGGRLVGTAAGLSATDDVIEVVAMYIDPGFRGQGCADRLLDALAADARERGARRLVLRVTGGNRAASRCYTRYGFVPTGRSRPMERNPELVEIEMALDLTPGAEQPASARGGAAAS